MIKVLKNKIKERISQTFCSDFQSFELDSDVKSFPQGYFKSFGNQNSDKTFYVIWLDNCGSGFFSNVSNVLCHIDIAKKNNMIPIVDFQNFKTIYNEKEEVNGTKNAWEYYFKQVSDYSLDEVYKSKNVFFCSGLFPENMDYSIHSYTDRYDEFYAQNILLKNHILELFNEHIGNVKNQRTLGVHFRGKEQNYAPSHTFAPTEKQMLKYTNEIIKKYNIEKIFLVTEEPKYLELFIKNYGDMLIYTDSFRCSGVNAYNIMPRENHRYLLGLEVLVDSLLLSECTGILCGDSNVSAFAQFKNNKQYEFSYNIRNGINSKKPFIARYLYNIKKRLPKKLGGLADIVYIKEKIKD